MTEPTTFRIKPSYQFFYSLPVLLALAQVVDIILAPNRTKGLVLFLILIVALLSVPLAWTKVVLDRDRLIVQTPLRKPRSVELRQLVQLEESSRRWHSLILRYHPVDGQGRMDRSTEAFLSLPPLEDQVALEERLRKGVSFPL